MSDFLVLPNRSSLVENTAQLAAKKLGLTSSQANSFASGAVDLLWGQVAALSPEQVLAVATDAKRLSAALREFEERANAVAMWADQYRGSPDGHVVPEKLPRTVA